MYILMTLMRADAGGGAGAGGAPVDENWYYKIVVDFNCGKRGRKAVRCYTGRTNRHQSDGSTDHWSSRTKFVQLQNLQLDQRRHV